MTTITGTNHANPAATKSVTEQHTEAHEGPLNENGGNQAEPDRSNERVARSVGLRRLQPRTVGKRVNKPSASMDTGAEATDEAIDEATDKATDEAIDKATDEAADKAIDEATDKAIDEATDKAIDEATDKATDEAADKATDKAAEKAEVPTQPAKKRSILGMCAAPKAQPVARSAINAQRPSARKAFTVSEISAVLAVILVKKTSETGYPKEYFYPVTTDIQRQVQNELRFVEFRVAQDQQGQTFLLPTKLPHPDGFGASWSESAQKGAKAAVGQWVRMKANSDTQSYVTQVMQLARPVPSQESFLALEDAIEQALGDNLIDRPDHPVLAELGLVPLRDDDS